MAQLVGVLSYRHWDLGSIPRSPYIFHNFSINMLPCSVRSKDHHMSQRSGLPSVQELQSNGQNGKIIMHANQWNHTQFLKVKKGLIMLGQTAFNKPPKLGLNTPWFALFFI